MSPTASHDGVRLPELVTTDGHARSVRALEPNGHGDAKIMICQQVQADVKRGFAWISSVAEMSDLTCEIIVHPSNRCPC